MPEAALVLPDDIVGWIEDATGGKVTAPDCPVRAPMTSDFTVTEHH
jgi:hypothetical protein